MRGPRGCNMYRCLGTVMVGGVVTSRPTLSLIPAVRAKSELHVMTLTPSRHPNTSSDVRRRSTLL